MSRDLLDAYGIGIAGVQPRYLSFAESSAALRDGAIDAAVLSVGYPAAAVLEAATVAGVHLIGIDAAGLDALIQRYPYYRRASIPIATYPGMEEPIPTAAVMNWLFATESLDPAIVDAVLRLLQTRREELRRVNAIADQIDLDALANAPLPLHPASAAWLASH